MAVDKSSRPQVSIIVPTYDDQNIISDCLDCLLSLDYPKDNYEIIVVNDGSSDNTREIVEDYTRKHQNIILLSKENGGKGSAVNYALPHARGEYVVVIDSDSYPQSNYITEVVKCFEKDERVAVVAGYEYPHRPPTSIMERMIHARLISEYQRSVYRTAPVGTGTAFKKAMLTAVGGFSEKTTSTTAVAVDLILNRGYLIGTARNTCVEVIQERSFGAYLKQRLRWREHIRFEFNSKVLFQNAYTHGLSVIQFLSIILFLYSVMVGQFNYVYLLPVALVFSIDLFRYSNGLIHMIRRKQRTAFFLLLSVAFEELLRFVSVPYLIFRLLRPRKKPTFTRGL